MTENKTSSPVHKISYGSVSASIFKQTDSESKNSWFSVNISKSYNKGTKESPQWNNTNNYNKVDLPNLEAVTREAFAWTSKNKPSSE